MKTAVLKASEKDKLRFEVHSHSSQSISGILKRYMKAIHPVEAAQRTQAIGRSLEWFGGPNTPITPSRRGMGDGISSSPSSRRATGDGYQSTGTGTDGESWIHLFVYLDVYRWIRCSFDGAFTSRVVCSIIELLLNHVSTLVSRPLNTRIK
ncbi:hypothetical protein BT96DRAFT_196142 [Gymnopus androsaceus JB14]|uniref:Uncharacterized protein n=1 Tax=Gymnopus androsaceus JB14 TaxID=1447944 RepID=A0A6A4GB18_9AGAR|nr:hypothetical protein BT96DRAFT_196142 [Gymnopus androsaceus JB14]